MSTPAFCPTCHEEYPSCPDAYYDKRTGEFAKYSQRRADSRNILTCCKCPKGHVAHKIGTTAEECPVCHTVPRYPPFSGIQEPCYVPTDIAKTLNLKGPVTHLRIGDVVVVKRFDGQKYKFDPRTGKPFGEWRTRENNKLCFQCLRELDVLRKLKQEIVASRQSGYEVFAALWYPSFDEGPHVFVSDARQKMEHAWRTLMNTLGEQPTDTRSHWNNEDVRTIPIEKTKDGQRHNATRLIFRKDVAAAIQGLFEAINEWGPAIAISAHDRARICCYNWLTAK